MNTHIVHRTLHITASVLALLAAIVITFGVIPDVRTDSFASSSAVPGFWVNVVCNVLVGIGILAGTFMAACVGRRVILAIAATIVFFLGIALLDASLAFSTHGSGLDAATARIFICALADLAAGTLIVLVAVLRHFSSARREHEIEQLAEELTVHRRGTTSGDNWDEAVDIYNERHGHRSDATQDQSITPPGSVDQEGATSQPVGSHSGTVERGRGQSSNGRAAAQTIGSRGGRSGAP